LGELVVEKR